LEELKRLLAEPSGETEGRRLAWGMARTYQAALLCEAAGWALDKHGDARTATAASIFTAQPLIDAPMPVSPEDAASLAFD
jgi:hypothetical protein